MWNMINYEVCGRGHFENDIPCQDKTKTLYNNETYVIALADGAGSAKFSHYGADIVVNTISKILSESFDMFFSEENALIVKEKILNSLLNELKELSNANNWSIRELASTLLAVAIKDNRFLAVHLGDGVIGVVKNNILKVASKPENGQYANVTTFVTSVEAFDTIKIFKGSTIDIDGFVIMSDGTAESLYHKKSQSLSPATKNAINMSILVSKARFNKILQESFDTVIRNNTSDDCSIAIISNKKASYKIFNDFEDEEKYNFFNVTDNNLRIKRKKLNRYEHIISNISDKKVSLKVLSKHCHMKEKYLKKRIDFLIEAGIVECNRGKYSTTININN